MKSQRGFSLVELLIAIIIGLLAVLAATRAMVDFESGKRNSVAASDSMQNGFLALFALEADGAKAGWGLNNAYLNGCPTLMYDSNMTAGSGYPLGGLTAQVLAPAVINDDKNPTTGSTPDVISFYTGNSATGTGSVNVTQNAYQGNGADIQVTPPIPVFNRGDMFVVAPKRSGLSTPLKPTAPPFCLIGQVTDVACPAGCPTVTTDGNNYIRHGGTVVGVGAPSRYNKSGGLAPGVSYPENTKIFNLGPADGSLNRGLSAIFHRWFIDKGNLMIRASDVVSGGKVVDSVAVANIVNLKAQYGIKKGNVFEWSPVMKDVNGDGTIGDPGDWQSVVSVRVAIVARSVEVDKPDPGASTCATTPTLPKVFNDTGTGIAVDVAVPGDSADWTCYRYRVFETIIPLRNSVWTPPAYS